MEEGIDTSPIPASNLRLPSSVSVPGFHGHFDHRKEHAYCGKKSLCPLPVLLVPFYPSLQISDAPAVAIARQAGHLRLQHAQIAQDLSFEFIHHPHPTDSIYWFSAKNDAVHNPSGRLINSAVENS